MIECYFDICPYHDYQMTKEWECGPFCSEEECYLNGDAIYYFTSAQKLINEFREEIRKRNKI